MALQFTSDNFEAEVLQSEQPVLVDFWAEWCGPCRLLGPVLERKIAAREGAMLLAKVDVDKATQLAVQFNVQSIPMVVAFRDGSPVDQFMGVLPEPEIDAFLERLSGPTAADGGGKLDPVEEAAPLEEVDPARAEALYREALEATSDREDALLGLARCLLRRDDEAEARKTLERILPGGQDDAELKRLQGLLWVREKSRELGGREGAEKGLSQEPESREHLYALGCALAAEGEYPKALETFLQAAAGDRAFARDPVREAMVQTFYIVGVRSELADNYRAQLTSLLY